MCDPGNKPLPGVLTRRNIVRIGEGNLLRRVAAATHQIVAPIFPRSGACGDFGVTSVPKSPVSAIGTFQEREMMRSAISGLDTTKSIALSILSNCTYLDLLCGLSFVKEPAIAPCLRHFYDVITSTDLTMNCEATTWGMPDGIGIVACCQVFPTYLGYASARNKSPGRGDRFVAPQTEGQARTSAVVLAARSAGLKRAGAARAPRRVILQKIKVYSKGV